MAEHKPWMRRVIVLSHYGLYSWRILKTEDPPWEGEVLIPAHEIELWLGIHEAHDSLQGRLQQLDNEAFART